MIVLNSPARSSSEVLRLVDHASNLWRNPDILQVGIPERWMNSPAEEPNSVGSPRQRNQVANEEGYRVVEECSTAERLHALKCNPPPRLLLHSTQPCRPPDIS